MGKKKYNKILFFLSAIVFIVAFGAIIFPYVIKADAGEDIIISSNTSWPAGEYTYRDITITNNATLTLEGDTGSDSGVTINARNISVESGSAISADGQGYPFEQGSGAGTNNGGYGGGGAYGGDGGNSRYPDGALGIGGDSYGSTLNPNSLGSGGGRAVDGGSGGGLVKLNLTGDLAVEGSLTANGINGNHTRAGGGSGGGLNINVGGGLSGAGSISAYAGNGGVDGGGGGGGRVAIYYQSNTFDLGTISVDGGTGRNAGGDGSIFTFNTSTLDLSVSSDLILPTDEGIDENGSLDSSGQYHFNDLTVSDNSTLTLEADTGEGTGIKIYADSIQIDLGSTISANGQGYTGGNGPGAGSTNIGNGSGASHGGVGGAARYISTVADTYGEVLNPTTLGSGGGATGGSGGGAIEFIVDDSMTVNGTISVNGDNGVDNGGGSGGSIKINVDELGGNGNITANGGDTTDEGGGGGGGRIAIFYSTLTLPTANITTSGGDGYGAGDGEDGSIFYYNTSTGDVDITNNMTFYANQGINRDGTLRSDGVYYYNNLTISNNSTVTVAGYWTDESDGRGVTVNLDGDLTIEAGSKISATGQGYTTSLGQGKGVWSGGLDSGSGGGYGGAGGDSPSGNGGSAYGNNQRYYPYYLGSAGGDTHGTPGGGSGGGAITVRALGDIIVNGSIEANGSQGGDGLSDYAGGGGSGGSVFIVGDNFSGTGTISADGGECGPGAGSSAGGGGGGRISIAYFTSFGIDENNISIDGGSGEDISRNGFEGTKYVRQMVLPAGEFELRNPNNNSTQYTNSRDVEIVPTDQEADEYYEASTASDPTPAFYVSGWSKVNSGKELSANEGSKTVRAWIKNDSQLISSSMGTANIVLDQTEPVIDLDNDNQSTTENKITISGTITDELSGADYIQINGTSHNLSTNSFCVMVGGRKTAESQTVQSFEAEVSLAEGTNNIVLIAFDRAGNSQSDSLTITRTASEDEDDDDGDGNNNGGSDDNNSNILDTDSQVALGGDDQSSSSDQDDNDKSVKDQLVQTGGGDQANNNADSGETSDRVDDKGPSYLYWLIPVLAILIGGAIIYWYLNKDKWQQQS